MKDTNGKNRRRRHAADAPEISIIGIDIKPAPDAEERLRRLFTILLKPAEDDLPPTGTDPSPDDGIEQPCA